MTELVRVSASQVNSWLTCNRRWGFDKILGVKDDAGRGAELGTAVHACHEAYLNHGTVPDPKAPWAHPSSPKVSYPGQLMLNMMPPEIYPAPGTGKVEQQFEQALDGVVYNGFIDWHDYEPGRGITIIDHKTSADPVKYGLTNETIKDDPQAIIYAWAGFQMYPTATAAFLHWNYGHSGSIKKHSRVASYPIHRIEANHKFLTEIHPIGKELRRLRLAKADPLTLKPNPSSCNKWHKPCPNLATCNLTTEQRIEHLIMPNSSLFDQVMNAQPAPAPVQAPPQPAGAQVNPPDLPLAPVAQPQAAPEHAQTTFAPQPRPGAPVATMNVPQQVTNNTYNGPTAEQIADAIIQRIIKALGA